MIQDYLQNWKQRIKIGSSYSIWEDITFGFPQGSILGPFLFNVFKCDFFLEYGNNYFANYVDENTKEVLINLSLLAKSNIRMAG